MRARFAGYLCWELGETPLAEWAPEDPEDFEITLDFYACPENENTADAFTVRVCSPNRFLRDHSDSIVSAENTIFMRRFNGVQLIRFLEDRCSRTEGDDWLSIAVQLNRLGRWEFDYAAGRAR